MPLYRTLWKVVRILVVMVFLFLVWLLFTADLGKLSLAGGLIGSFIVAILTVETAIPVHQATLRFTLPHPLHLAKFLLFLIVQLYASSALMLRAISTGVTQPQIVHFRTRIKSDLGRMVLASSITLTPGTITLDLNDDHLTVHWLFCTTRHAKAAGEAVKGPMEERIWRVWK